MAEGLRRNLSEQETNPDQSLNTDNDIELTDALLRRLGSIYEDMSRISKPLGEINNIHEDMRKLIIRLGIMLENMPGLSQQERIISEIISEFAKMHEDMSSRLQESESIYKEMYNNMSKLLGKGEENNQDDQ